MVPTQQDAVNSKEKDIFENFGRIVKNLSICQCLNIVSFKFAKNQ